MFGEKTDDNACNIGRHKSFAFEFYVLPVFQCGDNARIRRRTADAVFLERFDEARLSKPGWRIREMLFDSEFVKVDNVTNRNIGQ